MRPDDYLDSKTIDHLYGRNEPDWAEADGIIFACACGFWIWFIVYNAWVWAIG